MPESGLLGEHTLGEWGIFMGVVLGLLWLDFKVFHKKPHEVRTREALGWSIFWVALSLAFNAWIWFEDGPTRGEQFLTGYVLEKSLSVDNLFVFVVLFEHFAVPPHLQHRVLFFGILGAIVLRLVFILAGAALLTHFHWVIYIFGGFLILTALKLAIQGEKKPDPGRSVVVRLFRRAVPFVPEYHGGALKIVKDGSRYAALLLLVLVVIEATDVVFAVDSIPAIFAVTTDPYIVFTSNIGAILGLRALYFLLARFMGMFRYLKFGLAVILAFVGVKMLISGTEYEISSTTSLAVIGAVLLIAVVASFLHPEPPKVFEHHAPSATTDSPAGDPAHPAPPVHTAPPPPALGPGPDVTP